ncbi:hypothetical protein EI94DRAFT_641229 [Lactarius quietus]|nr:hypothetical protein EI94DRAFT_641229 [Lactarius quietus]
MRDSDRHSAQTLPDDVLLEIFDHHRQAAIEYGPWKWHTLAQVCRRWRFVVFSYPRRLELRILLTYNKPIRKLPKSWAALPIIICYPQASFDPFITPRDENHISNLLKNPARICELDLDITRPLLEKCASFLEEPFPALDYLRLRSQGTMDTIVLPSNFLNGSAPRLRVLHLKDIAIPMLPGLLSSSKNLVSLCVEDITRDGYFTAKDLAIGLSAATQLNSLVLRFHPLTITPSSSPIPGLPTRINLPSLTEFQYEGESTYLRDFASRINVPIIEQIDVSFSYESEYNTHELCEFFSLGEALRSSRSRTTHIRVSKDHITFSHHFFRFPSSPGLFRLRLPYRTRYPTPLVTQVCLGLESQDVLLKVTHLEIEGCPDLLRWTNGWDPTSWLTLLRALTGLQRFHIVGNLASNLVSALARVTGETICEILPALQELHFGPGTPSSTPASIKPFITERQRYGLPVSVHYKKLNWIGDRWSE